MKILNFGLRIYRKFTDDEMIVYAASAAFWMLISVVPFLMVLLAAVQFIPGITKEDLEAVLLSATPDMPQFRALIYNVTDNIFVQGPATILSISAAACIWTASSGVFNIDKGLRRIAGAGKESYIKRRTVSVFYTLIFIVIIILALIFLVLGSAIEKFVERIFPFLSTFISFIMGFRTIAAAAILFAVFAFIYTFMTGRNRHIRNHLPGALFASVGWIAVSYLFSIYFTYIRNLSYMYGSLGALVLLMFWIFAIICVIFLGAELNSELSEK